MAPVPSGHLAENVMHFARLLRALGLPIGPDRVIDATRAVETAGVSRRDDFYWTLASVFIAGREHFELFDQAFNLFWRDPGPLDDPLGLLMQDARLSAESGGEAGERLGDVLSVERSMLESDTPLVAGEDAVDTAAAREVLQRADFEAMTDTEIEEAKRMISRLRLPIPQIATRRFRPDAGGRRVDLRSTLRTGLRMGGDIISLRRSSPLRWHPPLVALCDVSGSMNRYARMFLHFLHAITSDRDHVTSFVFGTRLTNITRDLRHRDVDVAMERVIDMIDDWSGGTRIGRCLAEFNLRWSRRVLAQNATVLMITDGLDGDVGHGLSEEMDRLQRSCRHLIWLNPLLRYEGFEARAFGVRAMLPHVDAFVPAHSINSLVDLAAVIGQPSLRRNQRRAA